MKIVATMLTPCRELCRTEQFVETAEVYADIAQATNDPETASIIRALVRTRRNEAIVMRALLANLTTGLAEIAP